MTYTVTTPVGMRREYETEEPALHHARLLEGDGWSCTVTDPTGKVIFRFQATGPTPDGVIYTDRP
jgi:hypothetical protein